MQLIKGDEKSAIRKAYKKNTKKYSLFPFPYLYRDY